MILGLGFSTTIKNKEACLQCREFTTGTVLYRTPIDLL